MKIWTGIYGFSGMDAVVTRHPSRSVYQVSSDLVLFAVRSNRLRNDCCLQTQPKGGPCVFCLDSPLVLHQM